MTKVQTPMRCQSLVCEHCFHATRVALYADQTVITNVFMEWAGSVTLKGVTETPTNWKLAGISESAVFRPTTTYCPPGLRKATKVWSWVSPTRPMRVAPTSTK